MTATGEFSVDFRLEPDTADYTNPSFVFLLDGAQIESGLLNSPWVTNSRHVGYETLLSYNNTRRAIVEKNSPSTGGGESGPTLIDSDGNGYELKIVYDELRVFKVTAGERAAAIGAQINFDYPANTNFALEIDQDSNITAYADGVLLPFEPMQDLTYTPAALRPGWHSDRNDSGGGYNSGIYSFAADGVLSPYTIDSLPDFLYVGQTVNIETTGLTDLATTTTVGGKQIAAANAPDGDGTITIWSFVDGEFAPEMGLVNTIAVDIDDVETAPKTGNLFSMQGWQYVNVIDMNTGPWSLGSAVSGDTVITQAHAIDDSFGILNEDLTLTNWALGDYVAWLRDQDGIMHRLEFTVTQTGIVTGAGFVQFVEKIGFIQ